MFAILQGAFLAFLPHCSGGIFGKGIPMNDGNRGKRAMVIPEFMGGDCLPCYGAPHRPLARVTGMPAR